MAGEKLVFDAKTQQTKEQSLTAAEKLQRERDLKTWEQEQNKPKPPTDAERLQAVEDAITALMDMGVM